MSFANRLMLLAAGVAVLTAGILIVAAERFLRRDLERVLADEVELEAKLVAAAVSVRPDDLNAFAHEYGTLIDRRITLIDRDGVVVGDSYFDDDGLARLENHFTRPEVQAVLNGGPVGTDRRVSASTGRDELKVAVPAWPGVVRISAPANQVEELVGRAARVTAGAGIVAVLVGGILAVFGARAVARPVRAAAGAVHAIARDEAKEFPRTSIPEIRDLVSAFRDLHADLQRRLAQLHRERQETNTLIESMVEGVVAASSTGKVFLCNEAMRVLLRLAPGDPVPELAELFGETDAREVIDEVLAGTPVLGREVQLDGRIMLMTARPLPDGGAVVGMLDVTDMRRAQLVRRDFVANVSHELKTPLTSILGYSETLLEEGPSPETRANFLRVIHENAHRMRILVDDLLDLAQVESGAWRPDPELLDIETVAQEAWSSVSGRRHDREIAFSVSDGVRLVADRRAVLQILTNLLDNAYRHTPDGGAITVSARSGEHDVEILVRDTGSGIPPEHLPRVFERFYRVDPGRSRKEGGTGLGLAIVKHLCEVQGGRVEIQSAIGEGTSVRLHFPVVPKRLDRA